MRPKYGARQMPHRVLIVEDDDGSRRLLADLFRASGYEILALNSGEECLSEIESWAPDLLLLDIALPGIDGVETLSQARRLVGFEKIPAIAVTASVSRIEMDRSTEQLFDRFHAKPINIEVLLELAINLLTVANHRNPLV
jgi:CheY-like chemotaxis protein